MENGRRMPPNSMEAEQSVLGSMLLDQDAVAAAMETLTEEDFYAPAHQVIFSAMAQLYRSAQPIDLVTLVDVLEQRNEVTKAGGMEYIAQLSRTVPTTTNIGRYVAIVEDRSALRSIIKAGSEMVDEGFRAAPPTTPFTPSLPASGRIPCAPSWRPWERPLSGSMKRPSAKGASWAPPQAMWTWTL